MTAITLYFRYLGVSVRSQMEYRASFLMNALGQFLMTGIEFLGLWALFDRFGSLRDWRLPEVAWLYGMVNVAFSISDAAARGFDAFGQLIKSGDFDRLLLRPRSTVLQLAGQELTLRRVGRFMQGLIILIWAAAEAGINWSPAKIFLALAAILGGSCLFFGLVVLQATLAFWTTESLEIMNTVTYGGVETAQYPLAIYRPWFRKFFIFIIPLAGVNYFPALAILERTDPLGTPVLWQWLSPATGIVFLMIALQIWQLGVRHYRSTGS